MAYNACALLLSQIQNFLGKYVKAPFLVCFSWENKDQAASLAGAKGLTARVYWQQAAQPRPFQVKEVRNYSHRSLGGRGRGIRRCGWPMEMAIDNKHLEREGIKTRCAPSTSSAACRIRLLAMPSVNAKIVHARHPNPACFAWEIAHPPPEKARDCISDRALCHTPGRIASRSGA